MIQQLEFDNENVMGWRFEGKIDQAEYAPVMDSLERKMETTDHLNIYMEVPKMPGITPQAAWDGLKTGIANLKKFNDKLDKVAVVSDKDWLRTYTEVENRLFPGIEEKSFSFEEADKARQWIRS